MRLTELQAIFARLIAGPEGAAAAIRACPADAAILDLIAGDARLNAVARMEIYADAYFYRLLDVLKEGYPATLALLGETDFHNLVTGYLLDYPSSQPSIFHVGAYLAEYLRGHPLSKAQPWLSELAMLERGLLESFHSADAAPLDPSVLAALAPEQWPGLTLQMNPSIRIYDVLWRVDETLNAVSTNAPPRPPAAGRSSLLVWRGRDGDASFRALGKAESAALRQIGEGAPFAEICASLADQIAGEDKSSEINRMFGRWVADGLLCAA